MPKPLVIVESPAKAKTIARFLGSDFVVESSIGHIRDLPRNAADVPPAYKGLPWARDGVDPEPHQHGLKRQLLLIDDIGQHLADVIELGLTVTFRSVDAVVKQPELIQGRIDVNSSHHADAFDHVGVVHHEDLDVFAVTLAAHADDARPAGRVQLLA